MSAPRFWTSSIAGLREACIPLAKESCGHKDTGVVGSLPRLPKIMLGTCDILPVCILSGPVPSFSTPAQALGLFRIGKSKKLSIFDYMPFVGMPGLR